MLVHRPGRFLHRAVPSFPASPRARQSDRFTTRTRKRPGWNADDEILLRRADLRGGSRRLDPIERRHPFHRRNGRDRAGHDIGAMRRPRSMKK
jgi:hypothetical protein